MIYADHAASSPLRRNALDAMLPFMQQVHANPSSLHGPGRLAHDSLEAARSDIAEVLGARSEEVVFTSGGTESDNLALRGLARPGAPLVVGSIEHPGLLATAELLENSGVDVRWVPVDPSGIVDLDALRQALSPGAVCSVMYTNNEVGSVQPIAEIAQTCKGAGAVIHTDAVQAPGWLPLNVDELGIDAMSLSAHKFGGPRGVGCLYVRNGTRIEPLLRGGSQERGLRPGTPDVAGAVGMAVALQEAEAARTANVERVSGLRDHFVSVVTTASSHVRVTGHLTQRLANHASFVVDGINGETLLIELDMAGVACSSGSACAAGSPDVSHVLTEMGIEPELARNALRFTFDEHITTDEIDFVAKTLLTTVERLLP